MANSPVPPFGPRLRALRLAAGLSVEELAARAGLHPVSVYRLETGRGGGGKGPRWEVAQQLARALGVSLDAFVAAEKIPKKKRGRP